MFEILHFLNKNLTFFDDRVNSSNVQRFSQEMGLDFLNQ